MWPSKNKEKKSKKAPVVLEDYSDDNENDGEEIDWLNLPVKKPVLKKFEKPKLVSQKQNFMQAPPSQVINDFDEQPVGVNRPNHFDEQPVGARAANNFDE